MHSLRFELMSYLPDENYDTKALQQTSKNIISWTPGSKCESVQIYQACEKYKQQTEMKIVRSQIGPNLTLTWSNCSGVWHNLARFGKPEWNYAWLGSNFYIRCKDIWGAQLDGFDWWRCSYGYWWSIRYWCQSSMLWWPITVYWVFFGACDEFGWWWKISAARRNPSRNRSKGPGGTILPLATMNHYFATITKVHQKRFQWKLASNGSSLFLTVWAGAAMFFSHVDYLWVWQWFVREGGVDTAQMLTPGLSTRASPIGAILTIGSRHSTRSLC